MADNEISTTINKELMFDPKNLTKETIKKHLCPNATEQELIMGLEIAKMFNLNPLKREVYFVKYSDKPSDKMQVLVGYEVYLKRAERSGKYNGLEITSQGSVQTGDLRAIVKVYRKDWTNPLIHEAYYNEYVQNKTIWKDGMKAGEEPNKFWASKPITMIKKVAISQAFRLAFPDEFDGLPYTSDEVVDQERVIDIVPSKENQEVIPPEEQPITTEQGKALLTIIKKTGWNKDDLKEMIFFEFELSDITAIRNKHLIKIKEYFSKEKPNGKEKV